MARPTLCATLNWLTEIACYVWDLLLDLFADILEWADSYVPDSERRWRR